MPIRKKKHDNKDKIYEIKSNDNIKNAIGMLQKAKNQSKFVLWSGWSLIWVKTFGKNWIE